MTTDQVSVVLGGDERERICLTVLGRSHPECSDFWDGNWLRASVEAAVGGFTARFHADLRAEEFRSFRDEARRLYELLEGTATFETMEGQVTLVLLGDGKGHVTVRASLLDEAGIGNRLQSKFDIDQTYLPRIIESLDALLVAWPVLGHP